MLVLLKRAGEFYRLAQVGNGQAEYQKHLEHKSKFNNVWDIFDFISAWKNQPFFKIQDVIPLLEQIDDSHIVLDDLDKFARYPELINIAAEKVLKTDQDTPHHLQLKITTYLHLETLPIDPHILQEYQRMILIEIMTLLERMEEEGDTWWFRNSLDLLGNLYHKSTKFPKGLLEGLFKRFGMENYTRLISTPQYYQEKVMKKEVITKWDAAVICANKDYFSKEEFLDILKKCDQEAKEYFRGFIYLTSEFRPEGVDVEPKDCFMLSEDMTPMNMNMQQIKWPGGFWMEKLHNTSEAIQAVWGPIFADFGIVAH